jgi:hypothetical protein
MMEDLMERLRPEAYGALKLAAKHHRLGVKVDWYGRKTVVSKKHAEKAQKLFARALRLQGVVG